MQLPGAAAGLHRVLGIEQQVQNHLLNLFTVDEHERQILGVVLVESDVRVHELILSERDGAADDVVDVEGRALGSRSANEREKVADDLGRPVRFRAHQLEVGDRLLPRFALEQQLGEPHDCLQRVVQLVGDPRDELADGREPLAVNQLLAHLCLVRDVPLHADKMRHLPSVVGERDDRGRREEGRAVVAHAHERASPHAAAADAFADRIELRARLVGEKLGHAHAHESGRQVPKRPAERAVRVLDPAVRARDADEIVRVLRRRGEQPSLAVGLLRLAALDGEPRHQQWQHGKHRDRGEQIAEPFERAEGKRAAQAVVGQRDQPERAEHDPRTRRRDRSIFLLGVGLGGRRRQRRGPRIERKRHDPDDVVDEAGAVHAFPDLCIRDAEDHEIHQQPDRQPSVCGAPKLTARDEGGNRDAGEDDELLELAQDQERQRRALLADRHQIRSDDEM